MPFFWFNLFVGLNVLLITLLAMNVSRLRITQRVPHGEGDNVTVKKAIRAHGNGVEHTTVFGLAVLALQLSEAPAALLATLVLGFTAFRLVHAYGMLQSVFNARRVGAGVTYLAEIVAVVAVLIYGVMA
ncbi:MAPEG family protein [Marinobacteraceae bacterium S3BR75-40.1]